MRVLIVDDEAYMVDYIKKIADWEAHGFDEVLTAHGGSLARDYLKQHEPELLVTDIKMPKVSGLDLAEFVFENKLRTKVIIISGYGEFEFAQQAMRYGVSEYLLKPVLKADFVKTLERLFPKAKAQEEVFYDGAQPGTANGYNSCEMVKKYVEEHYGEDLSLEVIAAHVHLHPAYLSKVFKENEDQNLSGYITNVRMEKAAQLLMEPELKVHDVMEKVGYQKSQYFSKLFREKYGVTPVEYKKSRQQ